MIAKFNYNWVVILCNFTLKLKDMKIIILLLITLFSYQSYAKKIFEIYNQTIGKSVKVKRGQKINIKLFNEKGDSNDYFIIDCKRDTLFTRSSFILIHDIENLSFIKNSAQPSVVFLVGPLLMIGSPLAGFNDGKYVPKLAIICLGAGAGLTGLRYLYYKDAGLLQFNLRHENLKINPL